MMASPKPLVLLVEPLFRGHHGVYVRWIVRGGIQRGYRFVLATGRDNADHPMLQSLVKEFGSMLDISFFPENKGTISAMLPSLMARDYAYFSLVKKTYREVSQVESPALVFLPYLDYCLYSMSLFGSPFGKTPWGGIAMRPGFHLKEMGIPAPIFHGDWIKKCLFLRLLRNPTLVRLFVLDEGLATCIRKADPKWAAQCRHVAEPAEMRGSLSKIAALKELGIPDDAMVILVYGDITLRKGLEALFMTMQEPSFPSHAHVILAGLQDAEAKGFISSAAVQVLSQAGRLHLMDYYISPDCEYRIFAASDLLWLGYQQHNVMSGVLVQAGQMGLPVIGCEEGMIGWTIRNKQLGITIPMHDPRKVAIAIGELIQNQKQMNECGENGRRAFSSHTPDQFARTIFDGIQAGRCL